MGADEQLIQPIQSNPLTQLAALTRRVEELERQLAALQVERDPVAHASKPTTPVSPPPPLPAFTATPPRLSLENRIGSQIFSRIGILALLIAIALFLKLAIDNQWIGPVARVLIGLVLGTAVVLWSERFRRGGFAAFSYALKAVGTGALYLSLWAAFQQYHVLPAEAALTAMTLVTCWNAFMAWSQSSELLATYALAGALVTPLLLASGGNHEIFLFTYLLAIDIAFVLLVRLKDWPRLLLGAFPATVAYFTGWYIQWFNAYRERPVAITIVFLAFFFISFVMPTIGRRGMTRPSITEIFLPFANATFTALALYSVLEDGGYHSLLAWIAVLFAAIYLGLMRAPQSRVSSAVHLALALVFLTVAIPLKATGHWITVGWFSEGAVFLWVAARVADETSSSRTLRRLAACALLLGLFGILVENLWLYERIATPFLNQRFMASAYGVAMLGVSAWISLRAMRLQDGAFPSFTALGAGSVIAFNLLAILTVVRELNLCWPQSPDNVDADLQRSLATSGFLMLYGATLLAAGFWRRTAFLRWQALILLVFTIAKAFLYDLRNLSQVYRVLSFLGLGALLMAVSFAYQKDWLNLRESNSDSAPPAPAAHPEAHPGAHH